MINLKTKNIKAFRDVFTGIANITPEIVINFLPEGIKGGIMCPSNVAAVYFFINSGVFHEYSISPEDKIILQTRDFLNIIKACKDDEVLCLSTDENNAKLFISFVGKKEKEFEIPLLNDTNLNLPHKDTLELKHVYNVSIADFIDSLGSSTIIGKSDTIYFENNKLKLFVGKDDMSKKTKVELIPSKYEDVFKVKYNCDFINKFVSSSISVSFMKLSIDDKAPLMIDIENAGRYSTKFIIAPIIEND